VSVADYQQAETVCGKGHSLCLAHPTATFETMKARQTLCGQPVSRVLDEPVATEPWVSGEKRPLDTIETPALCWSCQRIAEEGLDNG
jgi:hypothetical protein